MKTKIIIFLTILILAIFAIGCEKDTNQTQPVDQNQEPDSSQLDWKEIPFKDVNTGQTFKISDFAGKPILLESFAVWCPTCKKQQDKIKELHEEVGDSVVSISLDTDPNEDESAVLDHVQKYGFDWIYAVSPVDLTQQLVDQYGFTIVNAPSAPILLICEDQTARFLKSGVKDAEELKQEIERGC